MRPLILTFVALLVLTVISWGVSGLPLGRAEIAVALGIATLKASLVIAIFMHLLDEQTSTVLALLSGVFFVTLLATFVAAEVASRAPPTLLAPQ
jgi:cytochrome c oxidase subunit 4